MPKAPHILIIAGDPSADRHGAKLVDALRQKRPDIRVSALGGEFLKSKSAAFLYPLVGLGGFGFWEPLTKLPQLWAARKAIQNLFKQDRPDVVVPIDYYGFNIHIARLTHKIGIPVVYYISPQVWASRPERIKKLGAAIDKMLVIFPFERELYAKAGIPVQFVGHPLLESMPIPGAESPTPIVGLLPGSRRGVVSRHLPVLIQTAELLRREFPKARFVLFRPSEIELSFYEPYLAGAPWIELTSDPVYDIRTSLWLAIGVSGTAALENMLLGIPMIIMYKLSPMTYWIAKRLIRIDHIGIPNILAGRTIVSEVLQEAATPDNLAAAAKPILQESSRRQSIRESLLTLRATLKSGGTTRAAEEILAMLP